MIKELRIGNLVEKPKGFTHVVKRLVPSDEGQIHGLLITSKLLLYYGFTKTSKEEYCKNLLTHHLVLRKIAGFWYPIFYDKVELESFNERCISGNRIQFFHQLQNIIFVITGHELIIES